METSKKSKSGNAGASPRLRVIRWKLLDVNDQLAVETRQTANWPFFRRLFFVPLLWLLRMGLSVVTNLLSLPIYLTRSPQISYHRYARWRGERYLDSYVRFKKNARFTVYSVVVVVVAFSSAVTSATFLRNKKAQVIESKQVFHVGILKRASTLDPLIVSFKRGLAERGYQDGVRILYDEQVDTGDGAALEGTAGEFVRQRKDLIFAVGDLAAQAVKKATANVNVPAVFYANFDPVEDGLIKSYARSENNLVGVGEGALVNQQVELLQRIAPATHTVGVLSVPADGTNQSFVRVLIAVASVDGLILRVRTIETAEDIPAALDGLVAAGTTAIYLAPSTLTAPRLEYVANEVLARKMILVGNSQKNVEAGALFALMADLDSVGQQLASQAEQIFRGVPPSQISSQFPSKSLFALNLQTASVLNLAIPADIMGRADVQY